MTSLVSRPSVLRAIDAPKPWGWEKWLTSTRPEGAATLAGTEQTLAALVATQPEVLGGWARRLFGDEMPIFTKLIHTGFPARVHLGFRRAVPAAQLLGWLEEEQTHVRRLFAALRIADARRFATYQGRYEAWATRQALKAWRRDDDATTAAELAEFLEASFDLRAWLSGVRGNRAAIVETLNEVDLKEERGNLLLSGAGVVHAIFGLSHQTHPLDRSRAALQTLFATLGERSRDASDDELARLIDAVSLPSLRATNHAPPKNEAWLPALIDGAEILVEPQQTSDTTYSLADFYTPLTWGDDRVRFRKGEPTSGLSRDELTKYLADVDFAVTPVASMRRSPRSVASASEGATLSCLVDEPATWPFFTAYQLELTGSFTSSPPLGVFQQIVVTRGRVSLHDHVGALGELSSSVPAFVPATLDAPYTLTAREPSTVMIFAVPGARGGAPRLHT
jgi:hypothetical protein